MLQQPPVPLKFINQGNLPSLPQNALFTREEPRLINMETLPILQGLSAFT